MEKAKKINSNDEWLLKQMKIVEKKIKENNNDEKSMEKE